MRKLVGNLQEKAVAMAKDANEKLATSQEQFQAACREKNLSFDSKQLKGSPAHGILDLARFHDLVVMGLQSHFHFETEDGPGDTLQEVLDFTSVPVLLTPAFETDPFRRALGRFRWQFPGDTRPAFLRRIVAVWRPEVRVVTSVSDKKLGGHLLDEAQKYLQSCGIESITTELAEEPIEEAIEERHLEWADLIVAGVRSKTPLKRLFLGSFARYLVEQSHRTLLLCQ